MDALVISQKDYAVGDLICSEMPLVNVLFDDEKSKFCDNCLCPSSDEVKLKKCSGCKHMYYCSTTCQKADWNSSHKYECQIYRRHYDYLKQEEVRLFFRTYFLLKHKKELASRKVKLQFDESAAKSFSDLDKGERDGPFIRLQHMKKGFEFILDNLNYCNIKNFDRRTLFEYYCRMDLNSLSVYHKYDRVAYGIYTSSLAFGHSCTPSATRSFNGFRLEIRAIREIKKGEPITICLAHVLTNREKRRSLLKSRYFIDCKCERCTGNLESVIFARYTEPLEEQFYNSDESQLFGAAFLIGQQLILLYQRLGGYERAVSWHLMRLVELYRKMSTFKQDGSIVGVLETTLRHLKVSHGVDHPHYKEYSELLEKYRKKYGKTSSNAEGGDF